jgi:hypothetical protein
MRPDVGRFLEGRLLETQLLIKSIYDLATGEGKDVVAAIDGRELVFRRGEAATPGFLRVLPAATSVTIGFPKGPSLFDPGKRLKGVANARRSLVLRSSMDLDPYVRRLIDEAYRIESPAAEEE